MPDIFYKVNSRQFWQVKLKLFVIFQQERRRHHSVLFFLTVVSVFRVEVVLHLLWVFSRFLPVKRLQSWSQLVLPGAQQETAGPGTLK